MTTAAKQQLALHGGARAVNLSLQRQWPEITKADRQAVMRVLDRGVLSGPTAPEISALERDFADYLGVEYCLALNSGTAALHCCCAAAGLGAGDEVIVPALTFIASAMAVCHQGATPVFCDIDPATYNIDPNLIEERITEHTKAVMAVHLHGLPCDMDQIRQIADRYGLLIIEDAAQAPGATYKGQKVGRLGHSAGFSLQQTKNLSGGEGGLFVTKDERAYRTAARLRIFGEDADPPGTVAARPYLSYGVGFNYRDHELSAALARSQLSRLDHYNHTAQTNACILTNGLSHLEGIDPPHVPPDRESVFHKYRVRLCPDEDIPDSRIEGLRQSVVEALRAEGVGAVLWQLRPLPAQPVFRRGAIRSWQPHSDRGALREWDPAEYPETVRLLAASFVIAAESAPLMVQPGEVIEQYVAAIRKVLGALGQPVERTASKAVSS